ncbi:MAG: glycogen/starch synthase [Muribaculaceae bacterium]|nr:glycogen/starch synthase [Muribaculaceae bacterium]
MAKQKVLYIAQQINPYLPETPMSMSGRQIMQGIQERGYEVRTFMPKYGCINERRNQLHEVIRLSGMNLIIDDTDHPLIIKVATLQPARMQVYFIDNEDYFMRPPVKDLEIDLSPEDNDERIIFYARGVIETVKKLRWEPAIVHCSGWVSALAPCYLKLIYNEDPSFRNSRVVYSLYGGGFDGTLDDRFIEKLRHDGLTDEQLSVLGGDKVDITALNKLAITYADAIVVAAPDADQALVEFAKAAGKPVLEYQDDIAASPDRYAEFYNSLFE